MRLKVFALYHDVHAGLCDYAGTTVWMSLHRLRRYVRRVTVRLRPGPEGRLTCSIEVWLGRFGSLAVERSHNDPRVAVQLAALAARNAARRHLRTHMRERPLQTDLAEAPHPDRWGRFWDRGEWAAGLDR